MPKWKGIVGRHFTIEEFESYVASFKWKPLDWKPKGITVHHTSAPSLNQRPNGLTSAHIHNIEEYYKGLGWSAGPHLFVDQTGVWTFTPMNVRGVHAVSFNATRLGIEMLGDYDEESPDPQVMYNAQMAIVTILRRLGLGSDKVNFHRDDPKTSKTCPGLHIDKALFVGRISALMGPSGFISIYFNGEDTKVKGIFTYGSESVTASAHDLMQAINGTTVPDVPVGVAVFLRAKGYEVSWDSKNLRVNVKDSSWGIATVAK